MLYPLKGELSYAERSPLVGMQVPPHEIEEWQAFLDALGDRYWDEDKNPAYKLFLG